MVDVSDSKELDCPDAEALVADGLLTFLAQHADRRAAERLRAQNTTVIATVTGFHHPAAQRIQPRWRGERHDRHECVRALVRMPVRTSENQKAA